MSFIQKIALSLADELRQRYPLDEIQAAPSFHYDMMRANATSDSVDPRHYSLSAIRNAKCLFSISIGAEEVSVSIHKDEPDLLNFKEIEGLPEVAVSVLLSKESDCKRFILAEPNCIDDVLLEIEKAYPKE